MWSERLYLPILLPPYFLCLFCIGKNGAGNKSGDCPRTYLHHLNNCGNRLCSSGVTLRPEGIVRITGKYFVFHCSGYRWKGPGRYRGFVGKTEEALPIA